MQNSVQAWKSYLIYWLGQVGWKSNCGAELQISSDVRCSCVLSLLLYILPKIQAADTLQQNMKPIKARQTNYALQHNTAQSAI